ncbi:hypothetical protein [Helicobacter fennelliae]|uniref:Putative periplasmic protein n=1 Tax=Helicobacter fennelliae MRY12-0050 TaxID=1325130 RepID=T1DV38_9HELI|nr:hypothetical protein [Helicobacter fennelliae]GAD18217.1 putative periplasmic protein [Helicobacter fennelliae MRY12-0050]STP06799.1 putative periplasmic protein [Helicobacter fennelliae]
MKKFALLVMMAFIPSLVLADCASLMKKYDAPDPESKTMGQISRWIEKKVTDSNDAKELEKCMIAKAADNPNKAQVAGQ